MKIGSAEKSPSSRSGLSRALTTDIVSHLRQENDTASPRIFGLRCVTIILLAACLTVAVDVLGRTSPRIATFAGDLTLAAYVALGAMLLPVRAFIVLVVALGGSWAVLKWISDVKTALTQLPLTMLDLKIAAGNPEGFFIAIGAPLWVQGGLMITLAAVAWLALWQMKKALVFSLDQPKEFCRILVSMGCIGLLASHFWSSQMRLIAQRVEKGHFSVWTPEGVAALSDRVGPLTFLAFTNQLEKVNGALFFSSSSAAPVPTEAISTTAGKYLARAVESSRLPNIVLVHLESTFNPNKAFHLTTPFSDPLFEHTGVTQAVGQLRVNVVGGGSWVSEFEVLTGIDSRLFGYSGYYAHSSLSPYVRRALPVYLRAKGYRTAAYYAWPGSFYNARRAFLNYGFEEFADIEDLGIMRRTDLLDPKQSEGLDIKIADAAIGKMSATTETQPLFAFVGFGQNHGPHPCRHFDSFGGFRTALQGTNDFGINCELNEYILRLEGTASAFERLRAFLEARQKKTGRPYVILGYGDHQPHTFTGTGPFATNNYSAFRTNASIKETSYRIDSSLSGAVDCCGADTVPATLIPSILSSYLAKNESDLYLPINFYLFEMCGADSIPQNSSLAFRTDNRWGPPEARCNETLQHALPVIQRSGVFRYP